MRFEQMQKTKRKHSVEEQRGTFPEDYAPRAHDGGDSDPSDLLERIEQVLNDATLRALGRSTGIEAV